MNRVSVQITNVQCRSVGRQSKHKPLTTQHVEMRDVKAVVVGGGISGLLSAHVLSKYCKSIIMVDKDDLSSPPRVGWNPVFEVSRVAFGIIQSLLSLLRCQYVYRVFLGGKVSRRSASHIN